MALRCASPCGNPGSCAHELHPFLSLHTTIPTDLLSGSSNGSGEQPKGHCALRQSHAAHAPIARGNLFLARLLTPRLLLLHILNRGPDQLAAVKSLSRTRGTHEDDLTSGCRTGLVPFDLLPSSDHHHHHKLDSSR
nr:hypothetical protein CFP56_76249 [Quercus suber]